MLIIDKEMPTCCEDCFAQQEYYNRRWDETEYSCGINGENLGTHCRQDWGEWHCDKPEWCPLKEMKDDGYAKIKEPDCRICGQSHCKYYHESRKPAECKSYIRMEGR